MKIYIYPLIILFILICFPSKAQVILYEKEYGFDEFYSFKYSTFFETAEGDIMLTGSRFTTGVVEGDLFIQKLDSDGNELWQRLHETISEPGDFGIDGMMDQFGDYIFITGGENGYVIKYTPEGEKIWRSFKFIQNPSRGMVEIENNNILICENDLESNQPWLSEINANGGINRIRKLSTDNERLIISKIKSSPDGNLLLLGALFDENGWRINAILLKCDLAGNTIWRKVSDKNYKEYYADITNDKDGNLYLLNGIVSINGSKVDNFFITKMNSNGQFGWEKSFNQDSLSIAVYGLKYHKDDVLYCMGSCTTDEPYNKNTFLMKMDNDGNELNRIIFGNNNPNAQFFDFLGVNEFILLSYYAFGTNSNHSTIYNAIVSKLKDISLDIKTLEESTLFELFPNPSSSFIRIKVNEQFGNLQWYITSMQGDELISGQFTNPKKMTINGLEHLKPGSYIFQVFEDDQLLASKILIIQ